MKRLRLSVITVAYNEQDNLARLKRSIDALKRPKLPIDIETVLVDNGSTDNTLNMGVELAFSRVVSAPDANLPSCRNRGIRESSGDWIAFIDADCEMADYWLQVATPALQLDRTVLIGWPVSPPQPGTWVQRAWNTHWRHKTNRLETIRGVQVVRNGYRLIGSANLAFTRGSLESLRGFNERLNIGEDFELTFRAHNAGILTLGVPGLDVTHHGEPSTLNEFYKQQLWHSNTRMFASCERIEDAKRGGNSLYFTLLFAACSVVAFVGLTWAVLQFTMLPLLLMLPLLALLILPAAHVGYKAKRPGHFLPLCVLYSVYATARMTTLLGIDTPSRSWRNVT